MIEVVNINSKESKKMKYRYIHSYCNSCNCKNSTNIISVRQDGLNSGTIINLCDKCLQELKKNIEDLEEDDERD